MTTWITKKLGFNCMHDPIPEDASVVLALNLVDGYDDPDKIYAKVKTILAMLTRGRKVVVICHAGLSRSPSMCITAIAWETGQSFQDTCHFIQDDIAHQVDPSPGLGKACQEALDRLNAKLTKKCPKCRAPIEETEMKCERCSFEDNHMED